MKQFRITSADLLPSSDIDCYLDPSDPIHALKPSAALGGLGAGTALHAYNASTLPVISGSNNGKIQREQGIKPGTTEWFDLWFRKKT